MKQLLTAIFCFCFLFGISQFKDDDVKYRTVFAEDLCKTLEQNAGYLLLDVRSEAEFNDTSSASPALNLGHLKNAHNINVNQLPQRWKELAPYKNKPVFVYCYSSQRSRRAARLLADSGFTQIYNINGGMSNFYAQGIPPASCTDEILVSNLPYKIISPKQLAASTTNYLVIDLRNSADLLGKKSEGTSIVVADERSKILGRFTNAITIPFDRLKTQMPAKTDRPVLLVDESGSQSPLAARMLLGMGFKNVSILFNGMEEWLKYITNATEKPNIGWATFSSYRMLAPEEFNKWMLERKSFRLVDIRPSEQFLNKSKNSLQNTGRIRNAVNIPYSELAALSMPPANDDPIVVYGYNSENEVFLAAAWLTKQGHRNVYVLQGGIWNLRWASANLKNKIHLTSWVVDVPAENQ